MPDRDDLTADDSLLRAVAAAPPVSLPTAAGSLALLAPGVVIDGFRIEERIGAGGMGVVYAARDLRLDREVALKVIRLEGGVLPALFEREARATARLNHPNIVTLHQFGDWNGLVYLVLERLRGETLHARLARGRLSRAETLDVIDAVLAALIHTHASGVVHRDLKPHNVFLLDGGGVKVLDFGVSGLESVGATRSRGGTPGYMAPEQWHGGAQDARTDLWAVGVLLHEMISGELPFGHDAPGATAHPPTGDAPLDAIIARCLSIDLDGRPADARELADAIARIRHAPTRRRRTVAIASLVLATAGAFAATRLPGDPPEAAAVDPSFVTIGGPGADNADAIAILDGDLLVTAKVSPGAQLGDHTLTLGPHGARGSVVARIAPDGRVRWSRVFAGDHEVRINAIAAAGDAVAIGGWAASAVPALGVPAPEGSDLGFVASLDAATGELRWSRAIRPSGLATVRAVRTGPDGAIYAVGEVNGTVELGDGVAHDARAPSGKVAPLAVAYAPDGSLRWAVVGHGVTACRVFGLAVDGDQVLISGGMFGEIELAGARFGVEGVWQPFLARFDAATGALERHRLFESTDTSSIVAIAPVGDGRVIVSGDFRGRLALRPDAPLVDRDGYQPDGFIAAIDADDEIAWQVHVEGPALDRVMALAVDDDRIVAAGQFSDTVTLGGARVPSHGRADILYAELGLDGRVRRAEAIGGAGDERARGIAIAPDRAAWIAGYYALELDRAGRVHQARGLTDGVAFRVTPAPRPPSVAASP